MSRWINADAMIARALQDSERLYLESVAKHTPSIDIVRCKECIHFDGFDCNRFGEPAEYNSPCSDDGNDFCSFGERKEI